MNFTTKATPTAQYVKIHGGHEVRRFIRPHFSPALPPDQPVAMVESEMYTSFTERYEVDSSFDVCHTAHSPEHLPAMAGQSGLPS